MALIPRARLTMTDDPGYFLADVVQVQAHEDTISGYIEALGGAGAMIDAPVDARLEGVLDNGQPVAVGIRLTKPLPEPGNLVTLKPTHTEFQIA